MRGKTTTPSNRQAHATRRGRGLWRRSVTARQSRPLRALWHKGPMLRPPPCRLLLVAADCSGVRVTTPVRQEAEASWLRPQPSPARRWPAARPGVSTTVAGGNSSVTTASRSAASVTSRRHEVHDAPRRGLRRRMVRERRSRPHRPRRRADPRSARPRPRTGSRPRRQSVRQSPGRGPGATPPAARARTPPHRGERRRVGSPNWPAPHRLAESWEGGRSRQRSDVSVAYRSLSSSAIGRAR